MSRLLNKRLLFFFCFLAVLGATYQNCSEKEIPKEEGGFVAGSYADLVGSPCDRFAYGLESVGSSIYEIDFDQGGPLEPTHIRCVDHSGGKGVDLTFLKDAFNVDVAAIMKNPMVDLDITVRVPANVIIGSKTVFLPALKTGLLSSKSTFKLENAGRIQGKGGKGGHGGACLSPSLKGEKGGIAVEVSVKSVIDTSAGQIFGGGGGGGGGGDACSNVKGQVACSGGGGGGGGAGSDPGQGGTFTTPQGGCANGSSGNFSGANGSQEEGGPSLGLHGGKGGAPGEAGQPGLSWAGGDGTFGTAFGQPGGEAGEAIVKNNNSVEIIGGGNIKGPILEGKAPERNPLPL